MMRVHDCSCPDLVLAVVASDRAVRGLRLDGLSVRGDQHGGHQTERAVALGDDIGLDITVVVLASPDEATVRLDRISDLESNTNKRASQNLVVRH